MLQAKKTAAVNTSKLMRHAKPISLPEGDSTRHLFVLLLNKDTFDGDDVGERLAQTVASALATPKLQLLLLHLHESEEGGTPFDRFFEVTPAELLTAGICAPRLPARSPPLAACHA